MPGPFSSAHTPIHSMWAQGTRAGWSYLVKLRYILPLPYLLPYPITAIKLYLGPSLGFSRSLRLIPTKKMVVHHLDFKMWTMSPHPPEVWSLPTAVLIQFLSKLEWDIVEWFRWDLEWKNGLLLFIASIKSNFCPFHYYSMYTTKKHVCLYMHAQAIGQWVHMLALFQQGDVDCHKSQDTAISLSIYYFLFWVLSHG